MKNSLIKAGWSKVDVDDSANVAFVNKEKKFPVAPSASAFTNSILLKKKERPIGVSILAVLVWINSGVLSLFALFALLFFSILSSFIGGFGGNREYVLEELKIRDSNNIKYKKFQSLSQKIWSFQIGI